MVTVNLDVLCIVENTYIIFGMTGLSVAGFTYTHVTLMIV